MTPENLERVTQKLLHEAKLMGANEADVITTEGQSISVDVRQGSLENADRAEGCLLYTSPSPRDGLLSRMPSSA